MVTGLSEVVVLRLLLLMLMIFRANQIRFVPVLADSLGRCRSPVHVTAVASVHLELVVIILLVSCHLGDVKRLPAIPSMNF